MTSDVFPLSSLVTADLSRRSDLREHLDDHAADDPHIAATLHNLERINIVLSGIRRLCNATIFKLPPAEGEKKLTIVDLGCGGGDLALWLSTRCSRKGYNAQIIGIDHDPRIAALAQKRCSHDKAVTILNQAANAFGQLTGTIDWVVSNHFLHHLPENELSNIFREAVCRASRGIIMNDLVRSRAALIGFGILCRVVRPAGHTAHDGIVSILRSFSKIEIEKVLRSTGIEAEVRRSGIGHQAIILIRA